MAFILDIILDGDPEERERLVARVRGLADSNDVEMIESEGPNLRLSGVSQSFMDELGKLDVNFEKLKVDFNLVED